MTEAPERIWIEDEFGEDDDDQWTYGTWDVRNYMGYDVEYVRADIVQALTAERDRAWEMVAKADTQVGQSLADRLQDKAQIDRLREALQFYDDLGNNGRPGVKAHAALRGESHE